MDLGKEIKKEAIDRDLSIGALADMTGMKRPYFSLRVNGHKSFTADELEAIARALGVPAWELMRRASAQAVA